MGAQVMADGWYRSSPIRRPNPGVIKSEPLPSRVGNLFSGLFRRRMAERHLEELHDHLMQLDASLAKENFLAVTAAHYQLAVEAAVRIKRPDLLKEFEKERDQAILGARSAKPLRQRKAKP